MTLNLDFANKTSLLVASISDLITIYPKVLGLLFCIFCVFDTFLSDGELASASGKYGESMTLDLRMFSLLI